MNVHSVTGSDTFHAVSGIVVSTSENESVVNQAISKSAKSQSFFATRRVQWYSYPSVQEDINRAIIPPNMPPGAQKLASLHDSIWQSSFPLFLFLDIKCPNWLWFMQAAVSGTSDPLK